ncbi:hypothetical protein ABT294_47740 [Nonomuraea sp. NPDC000554]|uniref:hypothetical protein n=1 Tax=Nonomuraea sp. NPDC000554 TaxID=3154259 RepID=UPI00332F0820
MKKFLLATALAGLALATVGATAASASVASDNPEAVIGDGRGGIAAEVALGGNNTILICDRSTDHRYAMARVNYNGHSYRYMNFYKDQDCVTQKTKNMAHGKIEFWACVSKPYKLTFDHCGPKQTVIRP